MVDRTLTADDLPQLFRDADSISLRGQRRFLHATCSRLSLAVAAAVCGALGYLLPVDGVEVLSIAAAAAFVTAFGVEIWLIAEHPERLWYDARALAESAKTLTWRFAVGGLPFPIGLENADDYFAEQLAELLNDVPTTNIIPSSEPVVSGAVSELRGRSLNQRRESYLHNRILDQQRWYAAKAHHNERRTGAWRVALIAVELAGALAAVLKAFDIIHIDMASVVSTVIGVSVAWLAVKQHESIARAYTLASHELTLIGARLRGVTDEKSWAAEVADAEEAISREHTMWRATRAVYEPLRHH